MIGLWRDGDGWRLWVIPAAALVSLATMRTRIAPWTAAVALILIVVGLEACRFTGPHVTEKMDATVIDWAWRLGTRANTGLAVLLAAGPIGAAASPLPQARQRALPGLIVGAPIGVALVISSLRLHGVVEWLFANLPAGGVDPRLRLERLADAVRDSERVLLVGVAIAAIALGVVRIRQAPARRAA